MKTYRQINLHPRRTPTIGNKIADRVASYVGSWRFVIFMSVLFAGWIFWNTSPYFPHFDPPEFILLNLCLSFIASYTGPFILMAQNRQAAKDRLTAVNDYQSDLRAEKQLQDIQARLNYIDQRINQIAQTQAEQDVAIEGCTKLAEATLFIIQKWDNERDTGQQEAIKV